ncbi:MAG: sialate O-acetylesterase, partial [Opitutaceae bacterium]|nr:sialate O-acetylesterase [Opitutaceae bacterium]
RKLVAEWNAEKAAAEKSGVPFAKKFPLGALNARAILEQHRPSCLFNGGIHPLGPQTLRGILWYQGEHNTARAADYPPLFKALIADWRAFLGQGDIPFLFCQLSAYGAPLDRSGDSYARLREAQRQVALSGIPATGMAVTLDLGVRDNVHFKNKRPVGHRLALLARALAYGETGLEASGPVLESAVRRGAAVRLTFAHADGLVVRQAAGAPSGFELAGDGGVFHPADASVDGAALMLVCDKVPEPRRVRYAWGNFPAAVTLFNAAGLPASPFVGDIR